MYKTARKYAIKGNATLQAAFKDMQSKHIITAQKHLCCGNCASTDLEQRAERMSKNGLVVLGAVYFHQQDFEAARSTGELYLGFGGHEDFDTVALGKIVTDALAKHGLSFTWDGTEQHRILVHLGAQS